MSRVIFIEVGFFFVFRDFNSLDTALHGHEKKMFSRRYRKALLKNALLLEVCLCMCVWRGGWEYEYSACGGQMGPSDPLELALQAVESHPK